MPDQLDLPGCWSEWNKKAKGSSELDMEKLLKLANSIAKRIAKCEDENVTIQAFETALESASAKLSNTVATKVDHKAEPIEGDGGVSDEAIKAEDETEAYYSYSRDDLESKTVKEIAMLCKMAGVSSTGKKDKLVANVLAA